MDSQPLLSPEQHELLKSSPDNSKVYLRLFAEAAARILAEMRASRLGSTLPDPTDTTDANTTTIPPSSPPGSPVSSLGSPPSEAQSSPPSATSLTCGAPVTTPPLRSKKASHPNPTPGTLASELVVLENAGHDFDDKNILPEFMLVHPLVCRFESYDNKAEQDARPRRGTLAHRALLHCSAAFVTWTSVDSALDTLSVSFPCFWSDFCFRGEKICVSTQGVRFMGTAPLSIEWTDPDGTAALRAQLQHLTSPYLVRDFYELCESMQVHPVPSQCVVLGCGHSGAVFHVESNDRSEEYALKVAVGWDGCKRLQKERHALGLCSWFGPDVTMSIPKLHDKHFGSSRAGLLLSPVGVSHPLTEEALLSAYKCLQTFRACDFSHGSPRFRNLIWLPKEKRSVWVDLEYCQRLSTGLHRRDDIETFFHYLPFSEEWHGLKADLCQGLMRKARCGDDTWAADAVTLCSVRQVR